MNKKLLAEFSTTFGVLVVYRQNIIFEQLFNSGQLKQQKSVKTFGGIVTNKAKKVSERRKF